MQKGQEKWLQHWYFVDQKSKKVLMNNHIPVREDQQKNKRYLVYPEEAAYLIMISELSLESSSSNTSIIQDKMNNLVSIISIYQSLHATQGCTMDCVYFYLKMRKQSKLLFRNPDLSTNQNICFQIYTKIEDMNSNTKSQTILFSHNNQLIKDVINQDLFDKRNKIKIYLSGSLDGIAIEVREPFPLDPEI